MPPPIEAIARRVAGKTELVQTTGPSHDRTVRTRIFDSTLDGLATAKAEEKNANLRFYGAMLLIEGFVPITMISAIATNSIPAGIVIGSSGAILGLSHALNLGENVERAKAAVKTLREKVNPDALPEEKVTLQTIGQQTQIIKSTQ